MTGRPSGGRLYALLLRLYPRPFREQFATEMEETVARELDDARRDGWPAVIRLWALALLHVLCGAAGEWWLVAAPPP